MQEHTLTTARTARYFTLGVPARATDLWFVCHGYGQLAARFLERFGPLETPQRCFVAPEGLSRFYLSESPVERRVGASWMTREDRLAEIGDYVRYLDTVYADVLQGLERRRVAVCIFGFSQGTATACRWLAQGTERAERLILWGGEIPPDLDLHAARDRFAALDLTLVAGGRDQYITSKILDREKARLEAHGIPFRVVGFDGGHELDEETLRRVTARG